MVTTFSSCLDCGRPLRTEASRARGRGCECYRVWKRREKREPYLFAELGDKGGLRIGDLPEAVGVPCPVVRGHLIRFVARQLLHLRAIYATVQKICIRKNAPCVK